MKCQNSAFGADRTAVKCTPDQDAHHRNLAKTIAYATRLVKYLLITVLQE